MVIGLKAELGAKKEIGTRSRGDKRIISEQTGYFFSSSVKKGCAETRRNEAADEKSRD